VEGGPAAARKRFFIHAEPLVATAEHGRHRAARATYYVYQASGVGLTVSVTVDLNDKKVTEIDARPNYPTPLSRQEYDKAVELGRAGTPAVKALYERRGKEAPEVAAVVFLRVAKDDPAYGHRLVRVTYGVKEGSHKPVTVVVDLTEEKVRKDGE